jgi:3-oxoacyl-[acyl-carrier protein] reductase
VTGQGCALVTGGSRGIGAAIARGLAQDGWPVAINYRADRDGGEQVVDEIVAGRGRAVLAPADVCVPRQVEELFEGVEAALGPVLVLVNNAGVRADGLAPRLDDESWSRVMETNLSGAFRATRRALVPMIRARFGRVVSVASVVGPRANAGQANYAASKAGLIGFTKTVAVEVARRGVTVNAVAPGLIDTQLTTDVREQLLADVPAGRAGSPEDVAACVRFLASEQAGYVTGTTLTVDGGMSA